VPTSAVHIAGLQSRKPTLSVIGVGAYTYLCWCRWDDRTMMFRD